MKKLNENEFYNLFQGIINFYGFIKIEDIYNIFKKTYKSLTLTKFNSLVKDIKHSYDIYKHKKDKYLTNNVNHNLIENWLLDQDIYDDLPLFTFDDINEYLIYNSLDGDLDKLSVVKNLKSFLEKLSNEDNCLDIARSEALNIVYAGDLDNTIYDFSYELIDNGVFLNTINELDTLGELLSNLYFNLRLPSNNYWTIKELIKMKKIDSNYCENSMKESKEFLMHVWNINEASNKDRPNLTVLYCMLNSYANLYGVIDNKNLFRLIKLIYPKYNEQNFLDDVKKIWADEEFVDNIFTIFKIDEYNDGSFYLCSNKLDDKQDFPYLCRIFQSGQNVEYFKVDELDKLIKYKDKTSVLDFHIYSKLVQYFVDNNIEVNWEKIDVYLNAIVFSMQFILPPAEIVDMILNVFKNLKLSRELLNILNEMFINVRSWVLKGNKLIEIVKNLGTYEIKGNSDTSKIIDRFSPEILIEDIDQFDPEEKDELSTLKNKLKELIKNETISYKS